MLSVSHRDRISASVPVDRLQVHECFSFCSFIKLIIVLKYVLFQVFVKIEKIFHICVFLNGIPWLFDYAIRGGHGLFFLFFTLC